MEQGFFRKKSLEEIRSPARLRLRNRSKGAKLFSLTSGVVQSSGCHGKLAGFDIYTQESISKVYLFRLVGCYVTMRASIAHGYAPKFFFNRATTVSHVIHDAPIM